MARKGGKKVFFIRSRPVRVGFLVGKVLLLSASQGVFLLSLSLTFHRRPKLKFIYHRRCVKLATDCTNTKTLLCLSVCILQARRFSICLVAFPQLASLTGSSVITHCTRSYVNVCLSFSTKVYMTRICARNNKSCLDSTNKP